MKITVLNGSPKGKYSVTLQYIELIKKFHPEHDYTIINISQEIKKIENNSNEFTSIINEIKKSDLIVWATPVYYFLIPAQLKRFIEIIFERKKISSFTNKYTSVITTSFHMCDQTAHTYMHAICDDLNLKYLGHYSAEKNDMLDINERQKFIQFSNYLFKNINDNRIYTKNYFPVANRNSRKQYIPGKIKNKIDSKNKKILIITDSDDTNSNLNKMINQFKNLFLSNTEIINLHSVDIKGGCLGCIKCTFDNECAYKGTDGYIDFYKNKINTADVLIFCGKINDRFLSSKWKEFFDRSFFNTYKPTLDNKQLGFIISGDLSQNQNIVQIIEAHAQMHEANLVAIVSDENKSSSEIDALLYNLAADLILYSNDIYKKSKNFYGVGLRKIFRDESWGRLRFVFQSDYKYFKKYEMFDFPQKDISNRLMTSLLILITKIPSVRKEFRNRMMVEMVTPYKKIIEQSNK